MSSIFRSEAAKALMLEWHERFRAKLPPTESRLVPTRFGDAHVLVGGPESAPPLVLLHGALATSAHVLGELAGLLERFRVYAVDVVGQSVKSADVRPSVANDDYGRWLEDVFDGLGLERAHLVGVSWGGFVSVRFAACAPQRLDRFVLVIPAGIVGGPVWEGFRKVGWPMTLYLLSPSEKRLKALVRHLLTTHDDDWVPYIGDAFRSFDVKGMRIPKLARDGEFRELTAPMLVVAADRDVSFPGEALLARAEKLFPSLADRELLKDCVHSPPTTDEFRRWLTGRIAGFLAGEAGAAESPVMTGT